MSRATKWIIGVITALVVVLGGSTAAYASYYSGRALPGTSIAGESVSGMTQAEIVENIQQRADDFTADLTVDGKEYEPSLSDLGITVDAEATAEKALTSSADAWSRVKGL
ncbi:MAG TPA: hypothetical protein GX000_01040, partial [Actinomyces sp.]|nr:hypothetical protein [Actinomyces sp.]